MEFTKMHAAGNDYIYVYGQDFDAGDAAKQAPVWCDRHKGIGADGIVLIRPSAIADFKMEMFNADGTQGLMCGNAARCIGRYLVERGLSDSAEISLETASGLRHIRVNGGRKGIGSISVEMGRPSFREPSQFIPELESVIPEDSRGSFVSMGNPHYVIFVEDINAVSVEESGSKLEHSVCFPSAANIEFAQIMADSQIRMRVWERGSGVTCACGTGACATAVAAISKFRLTRTQTVLMDGGIVQVEWRDEEVILTGDAHQVYDGRIEYSR